MKQLQLVNADVENSCVQIVCNSSRIINVWIVKKEDYNTFLQRFKWDLKTTEELLNKRLKRYRRLLTLSFIAGIGYFLISVLFLGAFGGIGRLKEEFLSLLLLSYIITMAWLPLFEGRKLISKFINKNRPQAQVNLSKDTQAIVGELQGIRQEITFLNLMLGGRDLGIVLGVFGFFVSLVIVLTCAITGPIIYLKIRSEMEQIKNELEMIKDTPTPTFDTYLSTQS